METKDLFSKIEHLVTQKKRVVIAIDGQAASGKSTLAEKIAKIFFGDIIHMDDYFLQPNQRVSERLLEIGGNIDYKRFDEEVIQKLNEQTITIHPYDCQTDTYKAEIKLDDPKLIIIEGAYALRKEWIKYYDLKILVTIDPVLQKNRIQIRNGNSMLSRFLNEWIPKENEYIKDQELYHKVDFNLFVDK